MCLDTVHSEEQVTLSVMTPLCLRVKAITELNAPVGYIVPNAFNETAVECWRK